jgi:hypothetical protein
MPTVARREKERSAQQNAYVPQSKHPKADSTAHSKCILLFVKDNFERIYFYILKRMVMVKGTCRKNNRTAEPEVSVF